jgi:hypothetical protein
MVGSTEPIMRIGYRFYFGETEDTYLDYNGQFTYTNDGTKASANTSYNPIGATDPVSGNIIGYVPITIGTVSGYTLVWSGAAIA